MAVKTASKKWLGYFLFVETALAVLVPLLRIQRSAAPAVQYGSLLGLQELSLLLLPHNCPVSAIARQIRSFATRHQKTGRHPRVSSGHSLIRKPTTPILAALPDSGLATTKGSEVHARRTEEVNAPVMAHISDHSSPDSIRGTIHYNNSSDPVFDIDAVSSDERADSSNKTGPDSRNNTVQEHDKAINVRSDVGEYDIGSSSSYSSNPNVESISTQSNESEDSFTINREQLHEGVEPSSHHVLEHVKHNNAETNSLNRHDSEIDVTVSKIGEGNSNAKNYEFGDGSTASPARLKDAEPDNHNITSNTDVPEEDRRNNISSGPEGTGESDNYNTTTRNEIPKELEEKSVDQGPETTFETFDRIDTAAEGGNEQDNIAGEKNLTDVAAENLIRTKRGILYELDHPSKSAEQISMHSKNTAPVTMPDAQLDAVQSVPVEAKPRMDADLVTDRRTSDVESLTNIQRHHQLQQPYPPQQIEDTYSPFHKDMAPNASDVSSNSETLVQKRQGTMSIAAMSFRIPNENPAISSKDRSKKRDLQQQLQQHILLPDNNSVIDPLPSTDGVPLKHRDQQKLHDMHYQENNSGSSFVANKQLGKAKAQQNQKQAMQTRGDTYTGPDSKRYPCIRHNKTTNAAAFKVENNVRTEQKCQWLCQKVPDCTHGVLDTQALTCSLKKGFIDISDSNKSTVVPRTCNDCWSVNSSLSGEKLQATRSHVYSPFACLSLCLVNPNCKYFTYQIFKEDCDIYGAQAAGTEHQSENHIMGSAKWCDLSTAELKMQEGWGEGTGAGWVKSQCMQPPNTQAGGHMFENLADIGTADICQKECQKRSKCLYFSFSREDHHCQLIDTGGYKTKSAKQYVAGPRTCNTSCFKSGVALPTNVTSSERKMNTLLDCQVSCYESKDCHTFSYCTDTMSCLHSKHSPREFGLQSDQQESETDNQTETLTALDTDNGNCFAGRKNFCGAAAIQQTV